MKIEKVSNNKFRCTLTKEDLVARQIELKELVYGSDKARMLFQEMVQKANKEFDFDVEDMPLMVEAIPGAEDCLVLVISKVEYPEEYDLRYSRFSEVDPDDFAEYETDNAELHQYMDAELARTEMVLAVASEKLEDLVGMAVTLSGRFSGKSTLYKDPEQKQYILVLEGEEMEQQAFEAICSLAAEYGRRIPFRSAMTAFYKEHMILMIQNQALEQLKQLR